MTDEAEDLPDSVPTLAAARYRADLARSGPLLAFDHALGDKLIEQLGTSREEMERLADTDFEAAKAESMERLAELRSLQAARVSSRPPLAEVVAAYEEAGRSKDAT